MSLQVVENIVKVNAVEFLPPVILLDPVKACEAASIFGTASLCRGKRADVAADNGRGVVA